MARLTGRVAGVHAPAFVERPRRYRRTGGRPCVSPGFTPRPSLSAPRGLRGRAAAGVSPGFTPRPSLSGWRRGRRRRGTRRVAGVHAPAFVERRNQARQESAVPAVSPGFTPRPSLSVDDARHPPPRRRVSPGFTPRPSLSGQERVLEAALHVPGVAGVHAPAFVERGTIRPPACGRDGVSPGFTPRPSLSGLQRAVHAIAACGCRRGSRPGLR